MVMVSEIKNEEASVSLNLLLLPLYPVLQAYKAEFVPEAL
jgi:hypothetical protein